MGKQNIPKGWQRVRLGDLGITLGGISGKNKTHFGHGKPFVTYMNVFSNFHLNPDIVNFVDVKEGEKQNQLRYGDYLFTTSSETPKEVGLSSVVDFEPSELYLNSFCFIFRPNNKELIEPRFGGYMFRGPLFRKIIATHAKGSTRFNLSKKDFLDVGVMFPNSKSEQKKIAEILSAVDEEIQKTSEVIVATEKLKRGLMQNLFTRGIGHTKFKKTEVGEIPEAWEVLSLHNVVRSLDAGVSVNAQDRQKQVNEIGVLKTSAVTFGIFNPDEHKVIEDAERMRARIPVKGDRIILSRMNTVALVGANAYVERGHDDLYLPDRLWQVEPKEKIEVSMKWLSYVLGIMWRGGVFSRLASGTSASMKNLSKEKVLSLKIAFPPVDEQRRIARILSSIDEKIAINRNLKVKLMLLKKGLMQDLLSGDKRVKTKS